MRELNLQFKNFRLINYDNLNELTKLEKEQMLKAGKACFEAPGDDFIHTLEDFLDQTYEGNCELWQVVSEDDPEKPIYDVWIVNVDSGVVFYAGTTKDTGVGMIQNYWDPIDEITKEREQLGKDLDTAFLKRPKVDYLPPGPAKAYQDAVREIQEEEAKEKETAKKDGKAKSKKKSKSKTIKKKTKSTKNKKSKKKTKKKTKRSK